MARSVCRLNRRTPTSTSRAANPEIRLTGTNSGEQWEMRLNGSGFFNFQRVSDNVNLLSLRVDDNRIQLTGQASPVAGLRGG